MLVPDVNVLLRAHFDAAERHATASGWLNAARAGGEPLGIPGIVMSGFIRIATNPRIFAPPATVDRAFAVCAALRRSPSYVGLAPGLNHWSIFQRLVTSANVSGPDVADAYLAAFAVEHEATFITFDRGFARFAGLRWSEPPTA